MIRFEVSHNKKVKSKDVAAITVCGAMLLAALCFVSVLSRFL